MKLPERTIRETLRDMAESVNPPDDMWEQIRKRLDLGGRVIPVPVQRSGQALTPSSELPAAVPDQGRAHPGKRLYAGLLGLTAAVAVVAVITLFPARETLLFQSSPLAVATVPAISAPVSAAEQPSTASVSLPVMVVVRN